MTDELETLRGILIDAVEDHGMEMWEHADWQPPFDVRNGEKIVDEDYYEELSDRERAMFMAGKLEAFGRARTFVDVVDSDNEEE